VRALHITGLHISVHAEDLGLDGRHRCVAQLRAEHVQYNLGTFQLTLMCVCVCVYIYIFLLDKIIMPVQQNKYDSINFDKIWKAIS